MMQIKAKLDEHTCDGCAEAHGKSAGAGDLRRLIRACTSLHRCRCSLITDFMDEEVKDS